MLSTETCSTTPTTAAALRGDVQPLRQRLSEHPAYQSLNTLDRLQAFMEQHVFAVWDFMSLLKTLQARLTCVRVPWVPNGDPEVRRLINEIVLGEESDQRPDGSHASHLEMYLDAMRQAGARTTVFERFLALIEAGTPVKIALEQSGAPTAARDFVSHTFDNLERSTPEIAAAFTIGREEIIPAMFVAMVSQLREQFPQHLGRFLHYLDRHIALDGDEHGPKAGQMLERLCGQDEGIWVKAHRAAVSSLQARIAFWDGILIAT